MQASTRPALRDPHQIFIWAMPQICRDGYVRLPDPTESDDMQEFDDVQYPLALGRDATIVPEFSTSVSVTASGFERRNSLWSNARLRFDVGPGIRSEAELGVLIAFFRARRGAARGFRLRDPSDFSSNDMVGTPAASDQLLGTGDGVRSSFPLVKHYGEGLAIQQRRITRPRAETLLVSVGGTTVTSGWTLARAARSNSPHASQWRGGAGWLSVRRARPFRRRPAGDRRRRFRRWRSAERAGRRNPRGGMSRVWFSQALETAATFWRVLRRDGVTLGFTTHDRDLWFDGVLHSSTPGMVPSSIRRSADFEPDSAEVEGALSHDSIAASDLAAGRFDGARVLIGVADWENGERELLYRGEIGSVLEESGRFTAALQSRKAELQRDPIPRTSPSCRALFCGPGCTLNAVRFTHEATLSGFDLDENSVTLTTLATPASLVGGTLRWLDGPHAGQYNGDHGNQHRRLDPRYAVERYFDGRLDRTGARGLRSYPRHLRDPLRQCRQFPG